MNDQKPVRLFGGPLDGTSILNPVEFPPDTIPILDPVKREITLYERVSANVALFIRRQND